MIDQVLMSAPRAIHHWIRDGMTTEAVRSHTGFQSISELWDAYNNDLRAEEMAQEDMYMSPDERQHEEDVLDVWEEFGSYLQEFVPPSEYALEVERLMPLIKFQQQAQRSAAG